MFIYTPLTDCREVEEESASRHRVVGDEVHVEDVFIRVNRNSIADSVSAVVTPDRTIISCKNEYVNNGLFTVT